MIARCTQDIRAIDGPLVGQMGDIIDFIMYMIFRLVGVVIISPVFLMPGVLVAFLGVACAQLYIKAQLSIKRRPPNSFYSRTTKLDEGEMSNARSPVLGHIGAAISGLSK